MYKQIDGVATGSLFGPALANIFVAYQEKNYLLTKSTFNLFQICG